MTPIEEQLRPAILEQTLPETRYPDYDNLVKVSEQIESILGESDVATARQLNSRLINSGVVDFVLNNPMYLDPIDRENPMSQQLAISSWISSLKEIMRYQTSLYNHAYYLTPEEQDQLTMVHDQLTKIDTQTSPIAVQKMIKLSTLMTPHLYIAKYKLDKIIKTSEYHANLQLDLNFFTSQEFASFIELGLSK